MVADPSLIRLDSAGGLSAIGGAPLAGEHLTGIGGALGLLTPATLRTTIARIRCDAGEIDIGPTARARMAMNVDTFNGEMGRRLGLAGIVRTDASITPAQYTAQELEYLYAQILDEPSPPNNAMAAFDADRSVPFGARSFRIRRRQSAGQAALYKGQGVASIPTVNSGITDESANVHYLVTSVNVSIFDIASGNFAGRSRLQEDLRSARLIMDQTYNKLTWEGADGVLLPGIFNHPYLAKLEPATPFTSASSADDILAALNAIVNYPAEASGGTFQPTHVAMGINLHNFLTNTRVGSVSDKSIMTYWLENNSIGLTAAKIVKARELDASGPGGTTGLLAYRKDQMGLRHVLVRDFTPLPMQAAGFEQTVYCMMALGGVRMEDAGCNVLAWVTV